MNINVWCVGEAEGQGGWGTKASSKSFADKLGEEERWLHAWFFTGLSQISFSVVHFNGILAHTPQLAESLHDAAEGPDKFLGSREFFMPHHKGVRYCYIG